MNSLYATRATTRSAKARLGSTTTRAATRVPDHAVPIDPGLLHTLVEAVSTAVDKRLDARDHLLRQAIDTVAANAASVQAAASLAPPSSRSASPRQRGSRPSRKRSPSPSPGRSMSPSSKTTKRSAPRPVARHRSLSASSTCSSRALVDDVGGDHHERAFEDRARVSAGCSPGETFSSGYGLLGQGVCHSLKEKIVAGNYIPLRWLRRNHSIDINFDPRTPPKDSSKDVVPVTTLQEWTQLFLLYQAIRLQAFPQEGYGMTTYMSHILRIADRAGFPTAAEYDGQFRIQWAERTLPWEIFRGDILFEVEDHLRHQRGTRPFRAGGTGSGAFTRHCFRFNKRGGCTKRSCPYSHRCSICRRTNHGASTCRATDKAIPGTHVK